MFGLKEEIIGGVLALALFVIAGFVLYLHHLQDERDQLVASTAALQLAVDGHVATEKQMEADAAAKEQAYAVALAAKGKVRKDVEEKHADWRQQQTSDAVVHAWADGALPCGVARRLRAAGAAAGAPGCALDPAGGAARADPHP